MHVGRTGHVDVIRLCYKRHVLPNKPELSREDFPDEKALHQLALEPNHDIDLGHIHRKSSVSHAMLMHHMGIQPKTSKCAKMNAR